MGYVLTEEQQLLKESARDLFKTSPVSRIRDLRDGDDNLGFDQSLWQQMIELGFSGLAVGEECGGLDFGIRGLGIIMEEAGRSLAASPLLSAAISNLIIEKYGSSKHRAELTASIEAGSVTAIAIQEGEFFTDSKIQTSVISGKLSGVKTLVSDAHIAQKILVSTQNENGSTIYLIDSSSDGIQIENEFMMDSRYYAEIHFNDVAVTPNRIIGEEGKGLKVINAMTNIANALLSAELLGLSKEAFERTVNYLKERRQFGVPIGSFQALQHRAAHLYSELELAESISIKALEALQADDFMAPAICSMAKVKCNEVALLATNEGVQMYGGIGMTDDEEIGFFLKRARVAAQQYGGSSFHMDRFASFNGY